MLNRYQQIILFLVFSLLASPAPSFAWHDYTNHDWDWYGSGRDHPYSYYIDDYYSPGYDSYSLLDPDFVESINQAPVATAVQPDQFTVNIPNDHGGYTPVVIKRSGNGYTGPQGEFYPSFPTVAQLKVMYGK